MFLGIAKSEMYFIAKSSFIFLSEKNFSIFLCLKLPIAVLPLMNKYRGMILVLRYPCFYGTLPA